MNYKMEELVPIVGKLAEKYTSFESTSVTYEKAQQLMGAVIYCIQQTEQIGDNSLMSKKGISAQQAYDRGVLCVEEKTEHALKLYNTVLKEFDSYENYCLKDTFIKGISEFFKWYDVKFNPQNIILTLDYPVLKDISKYKGIDRIYEYIQCIALEQTFLKQFPRQYVINTLEKYERNYKEMIDNICEVVFMNVLVHILAKKSLSEQHFLSTEYLKIQDVFVKNDKKEIDRKLKEALEKMMQEYFENNHKLFEYLLGAMDGITVRLKNAAENEVLNKIYLF